MSCHARDNSHIEDMDVSVIGISNDMTFYEELDPRAKDSLCEVEIHFPPYDADQLRSILNRRSEKAFVDSAVTQEAIALAAALAAQDLGSARQAIRYLYKAGEFAALNDEPQVCEEHVRKAEDHVEQMNIAQSIRDLTIQDQLALLHSLRWQQGMKRQRQHQRCTRGTQISRLMWTRTRSQCVGFAVISMIWI